MVKKESSSSEEDSFSGSSGTGSGDESSYESGSGSEEEGTESEEGSQFEDEGSGSYESGSGAEEEGSDSEEGSQFEDEGSGSYESGSGAEEEGSDSEEGSEGSTSGEGSFQDEGSEDEDSRSKDDEDEEDSESEKSEDLRASGNVKQKIDYFNDKSKEAKEGFEDEGSFSSGSESSDDGSSGSESEESGFGGKDDDPFFNETRSGSFDDRKKRWYIIGLGVFCVVLLAIAIGLGVGLSRKTKDKDEDKTLAPTPVSDLPSPTDPPVRMPIVLPDPPELVDEPPEIVDVELFVESSADTTIYRSGDLVDSENGSEGTMLVQAVDADSELPSAYSLVELSLNTESIQYILLESRKATFCLHHVPNDKASDQNLTYSTCVIDGEAEDVETLTGSTATYVMPESCVNEEIVNFEVQPGDTEICMDVTDIVFEWLRNSRRGLRGISSSRALQDSLKDLVLMIDNLSPSNEPGDRFYTSNTEDSGKAPSLSVEGEGFADCETIGDLICSDERFSTLCTIVETAQLKKMLGDNRGAFTLFAPTDDAITNAFAVAADLGVDFMDPSFIESILKYHVVYGSKISSSDIDCSLAEAFPLQMANGENTDIQCISDDIFVIGKGNPEDLLPRIIEEDINTCNGIVHAIDQMIFPDTTSSGCKTISEIVCGTPDLKVLCEGVVDSELLETLSGEGTFTVFGPTNDAFLRVPPGIFGSVNPVDIIMLHTVSDEVLFKQNLTCDSEVTMGNSQTTTTVCEEENVFQTGQGNLPMAMPQVIGTDIAACNGVVHVVDEVILPEFECQSIYEIVCSDETFSSLCSLIDGTDLVDSLSNEIITLFAPNNDALDGVDVSDEEAISQILRYHTVYNQVIIYEDLFCDSEIYMAGNKATTKTECDGSDKFQVGGGNAQDSRPKIVDKRENACNGVVHIIDNVMLPGEDQGDEECQTISDIVCQSDEFSILCGILQTLGLERTFMFGLPSSFTVFAPTNEAFAKAMENGADLSSLGIDAVLYHVHEGDAIESKDICENQSLDMLNTGTIDIACDGEDVNIIGGDKSIKIIDVDLRACNGIIHAIDDVLIPPKEEEDALTTSELQNCYYGGGDFTPMSMPVENLGISGDISCASFCWDCADSAGDDTMCTDEQRADGAKISQYMAFPRDSLEFYTSAYGNYNFVSCQTDNCNSANPCGGETEVGLGLNCLYGGGELTPVSMPVESLGMSEDVSCASFCWDCADSAEDDTMCTDQQRADGAKISQYMALPRDNLELYTSVYGNYNFVSCQTDNCNSADPCGGIGEQEPAGSQCQRLVDFVCGKDNLSNLCVALDLLAGVPAGAEFLESLDESPVTVFAPDDNALLTILGETLSNPDPEALLDLLQYHTVSGARVSTADLVCDQELTMGNDGTTKISCNDENTEYFIGGGGNERTPKIIEADYLTCSSVVHIVDAVILAE